MSTQSITTNRQATLPNVSPPITKVGYWGQLLPVVQSKWIQRFWRLLPLILPSFVLVGIIGSVVFANDIAAYHPTAHMDLYNRKVPPVWMDGGSMEHPFGTDYMGRDVFSRVLHGGRASFRIALSASTIASVFGICYGVISGYVGGLLDRFLMLLTNIWISFPFLVLALAAIAAVGNTITVLVVLLSLAMWVHPARITRAHVLKTRELDYVEAAHAIGAKAPHIIRRHIVPNIVSVNILLWTFSVGALILIEGSLSFIGLGVNPPTPSWGNMLSDGRHHLQEAWWISVLPGVALMLTVLSINAIGDALQKLHNHKD